MIAASRSCFATASTSRFAKITVERRLLIFALSLFAETTSVAAASRRKSSLSVMEPVGLASKSK